MPIVIGKNILFSGESQDKWAFDSRGLAVYRE
jgi:hypothetical protein